MLILVLGIWGLATRIFYYNKERYIFCGTIALGVLAGVKGYVEGGFYFLVRYNICIDLLSWSLIYLTIWIRGLIILASALIFRFNKFIKEFIFTIIFLSLILILSFLVGDLVWFYIFFEGSLVPIFFLISGWGYQPERLKAGIYLMFYTIFGSLPLLLGILFLNGDLRTINFHLFTDPVFYELLVCGAIILAFLVKMPIFLTHLWLPKAHVEAPVAGSMVLAGILLKLGGYGVLRVRVLFMFSILIIGKIFIVLSLIGGLIISLICLRQFDVKSLIAYSSVVHIGLGLAGIITLLIWGYQGILILMIGHGLCSSGLFAGANIFYERVGSRSLLLNRGMINVFPSLILWWFLLCVSNIAGPPSLNLLGEINLIISLISWSKMIWLMLALASFFSAAYSIYLFSLISHGKSGPVFSGLEARSRDYLLLVLHWIPLNIIILRADLVGYWV